MVLLSTPKKLKKAILVKELFYVSTMKGINNKIRGPCRNNYFQRSSIIVVQNFLKERKLTSSLLQEITAFREKIQENTISQRIRSLITSRLIMITDIITCWLCQYCPPKQGNDSRLLQSKDKGSHHEPACSAKV